MNIIAECGCNWDSIEQAKEMIRRSKEVGCFASKFQLFTHNEAENLPEHLYLSFDEAKELFDYGKYINQEVFFTCMYPEAVDMCEKIGVNYYKIRFKDNKNKEIFRKIVLTKKRYFISRIISKCYVWGIQLFCIPKYPARIQDYSYIPEEFNGVLDHTPNLQLLEKCLEDDQFNYFEKHMKLEGATPIENDWSVSFKELDEVLKKND